MFVIAALVLLVGIATYVISPPQPASPAPDWHAVAVFSSADDARTDTFVILGEKFQYTWMATPKNEFAAFAYDLYEKDHTVREESDLVTFQDSLFSKEATVTILKGGTFYFDVSAANLHSWSIYIVEWR